MTYIVYLVALIFLVMITYRLFHDDVMSPAVILCTVFLLASLFALYNYNYWKLSEWSVSTCRLILVGIVSFSFGTYLAFFKLSKHSFAVKMNIIKTTNISPVRIDVNSTILIAFCLISFGTMAYFMIYVISRVGISATFITDYKGLKYAGLIDLPFLLNFLIKFVHMASVVSLAVFLNNIVINKRKQKDIVLLFMPLCFSVIALFNATRGEILEVIFSGISLWYILYCRLNGWSRHFKFVAKKMTKWVVLVLALFGLSLQLGRGDARNFAVLSYLCNYVSGAIAALDVYLKEGGTAAQWFGQETFVTLNNNLDSIFKTGFSSVRSLEFRSYNGYSVVNIYTSFRRFYHDFGMTGVVLLSMLQGYITNKLYLVLKAKKTHMVGMIDFASILYSYFFACLIYIAIEDTFYSSNFSISGILKIIELFFVYNLFFYKHKCEKCSEF